MRLIAHDVCHKLMGDYLPNQPLKAPEERNNISGGWTMSGLRDYLLKSIFPMEDLEEISTY